MNNWDHQREYSINEIIEISREEASFSRNFNLVNILAEMLRWISKIVIFKNRHRTNDDF